MSPLSLSRKKEEGKEKKSKGREGSELGCGQQEALPSSILLFLWETEWSENSLPSFRKACLRSAVASEGRRRRRERAIAGQTNVSPLSLDFK